MAASHKTGIHVSPIQLHTTSIYKVTHTFNGGDFWLLTELSLTLKTLHQILEREAPYFPFIEQVVP